MHHQRSVLRRSPAIAFAMRGLGWICLGLAFLGVVLPIVPGWPFLIIGARLLGPRDPLIRWTLLVTWRVLRWLRSSRLPWLRRAGVRLAPQCLWATRIMLGKRSTSRVRG